LTTTVGYGDVSPVTTEGRFIATALMLVGIGFIGVFTATITSFFFDQGRTEDVEELRAQLRRIESAGADSWAFISACKPGSVALSAENAKRHEALVDRVGARKSLLILGISRSEAVELGRQFGQLALVWGHRDDRAQLVPCEPRVEPSPAP
jgi:hypothetical protein